MTTYDLNFNLDLSALRLTSTTKYNDNLRTDSSTSLNLARHLGLALSSTPGTGADAPGLANLGFPAIIDVPEGGTVNVDLRNFTDLAGRAGQAFTAYRFALFMLLPVAKGGTACSSVTLGGAGVTPHRLFMTAADDSFDLENGDWVGGAKGNPAGRAVDDGNRNVKIVNNDPLVAAKVLVMIVGVS